MRGRRHAIEGGRVVGNGRACFGYRYAGKKKDTRLEIEPAEAATVRQIFEWYTAGDGDGEPLGVTAIADKLNAAGMPGRKGGRWTPGTVYPILRRETYAGTWHGYTTRPARRAARTGATSGPRPSGWAWPARPLWTGAPGRRPRRG